MANNVCYACGSEEYDFYAQENGFRLVKCGHCGLLFVENRPDDREISQAHKQGIHGGAAAFDITGKFRPVRVTHYLGVLRDLYVGGLGDRKTWLDVGCGHGEFMAAVQRYGQGIVVKGTEPNVHKQASARQQGLDVSYFDIDTHPASYEVVSLLNVYSHLPDPPAFVRSLKRLLEPGGEFILETGDTAGLAADDHYRPFYLPDHLSFASEDIVVGLLEREGFQILQVRKYPFIRLSASSVVKELVKAALPNRKSGLKYLGNRKYAQTDMYIRAKLKQ